MAGMRLPVRRKSTAKRTPAARAAPVWDSARAASAPSKERQEMKEGEDRGGKPHSGGGRKHFTESTK